MTVPRQEQFSGCLIGQCLGDALGMVVEGYPPKACQQYVIALLIRLVYNYRGVMV